MHLIQTWFVPDEGVKPSLGCGMPLEAEGIRREESLWHQWKHREL